MDTPQPAKSKRSTMACIHCRERKVKCDNNNDGLSCERCKRTKKDCRYEPVNPITESQQSPSFQGDPPITGDKPIMTVYRDSSPSTSPPPQVGQWPDVIDPHLQHPFPVTTQGRPLHQPYESMNPSPLSYQPPQALPHGQYPMGGWQQPPYMQSPPQLSYGHQAESPYAATSPGYWVGHRVSNMPTDNSGDRPEDSVGEPSGSS